MQSTLLTITASVIVFLLVVLIHEFGHFAVAKSVGIKVNEFAIGMGPVIFKKQGTETLYSLRAFPLGGFCAMEGEEEESGDSRSFTKAPLLKRIAVIAAGPIMNFLLAILVLFIIALFTGSQTSTIDSFTKDSTAYIAGLREGDKIVAINGEEIKSYSQIIAKLKSDTDGNIEVRVDRSGELKDFKFSSNENKQIGIYGRVERSVPLAIEYSLQTFTTMIALMLNFLGSLFRGMISINDVSGPVGIVKEIGNAVNTGFLNLGLLFALININLGFFNLLPIPALDGFKILTLAIEGVIGRRLSQRIEIAINLIGFVFLIGLIIIVTFKDIAGLF